MSNAADLDMRENSGRRSLGEQVRARIKSVVEDRDVRDQNLLPYQYKYKYQL